MSEIVARATRSQAGKSSTTPRSSDPRVLRSRAAAVNAAQLLFMQKGFVGTTMDEIAELAGLTKRTLYNNYADKSALFVEIVTNITSLAEEFAGDLRRGFVAEVTATNLQRELHGVGQRLARAILRPEVIALRRLLIGESRDFPTLAAGYFDRAPGQVIAALAHGFERMTNAGLLKMKNPQRAAGQFAYLVVGEMLDRAILLGTVPRKAEITTCAREGVETFLARYEARRAHGKRL